MDSTAIEAFYRRKIGERCRMARRFVGENLGDVADAMGCSIVRVSAMERGVEDNAPLLAYWNDRFGIKGAISDGIKGRRGGFGRV